MTKLSPISSLLALSIFLCAWESANPSTCITVHKQNVSRIYVIAVEHFNCKTDLCRSYDK